MFKEQVLDISGYRGEQVPNRFLQQEGDTNALAVILPGFGYHADLPLLYYPGQIVVTFGMDLLRLETAYNQRPEYTSLPDPEQITWLNTDTDAALAAALKCRPYQRLFLIGKSLGTLAMAHLLEQVNTLPASHWVWLTPILSAPRLVTEIQQRRPRSLFAIGTADHFYNHQVVHKLANDTSGRLVVIDGGNHSLEIKGSLGKSIQALEQVALAVEEFVKEAYIR